MVQNYVLSFFNEALVVICFSYVITKIAIMAHARLKHNYLSLFFTSIFLQDRQTIRNTFDGRVKKYLYQSNKVNKVFYSIAGVATVFYLLMLMI